MDVSENSGTPKSSILIGFSIIFTIHFGGFPTYFWKLFLETPICFLVSGGGFCAKPKVPWQKKSGCIMYPGIPGCNQQSFPHFASMFGILPYIYHKKATKCL